MSWGASLPAMPGVLASERFLGSGRLWQRPSSLPSVTVLRSARDESSQHGSGLCPASIQRARTPSSMAHALPCGGSSETERRSEHGWTHSITELPRMSLWSPWRTSSPRIAWAVLSAATSTDLSPHKGVVKIPPAWKRCAFPLSRTTMRLEVSPPKPAQEQQGRKNSHNGVS